MFFFTSKGHFITQTRCGLRIHNGIEQPTKIKLRWKVWDIVAKTSSEQFFSLGIWEILNSENILWSNAASPRSMEKLGHAFGSRIIDIVSLQSVPKFWQLVCWSMVSIAQIKASSFKCEEDIRCSLFLNPKSCSFPDPSIHTQPYPLYCASSVHDPSTKQIFKLRICIFFI